MEAKENLNNRSAKVKKSARAAKLFVFFDGNTLEYPLAGTMTVGRPTSSSTPDLEIDSPIVSRRHGVFCVTEEGKLTYQDTGSKNGTSVDGKQAEEGATSVLKEGSVLRIHPANNGETGHDVVMTVALSGRLSTKWKRIELSDEMTSIGVGRNKEISLRGKTVSRDHAAFSHAQNGWAIIDHQSLNGVYLNGIKITEPVLLQKMDLVCIAHHIFLFEGKQLLYQEDVIPEKRPAVKPEGKKYRKGGAIESGQESPRNLENIEIAEEAHRKLLENREAKAHVAKHAGGRLSIHIKERYIWSKFQKKTLLKDIDLQVSNGELVLILGGSGAGKTTFMNAVMGYEPAVGQILYNGTDIYREFDKMKYEIGYVPQQDLLRMEDVVYDTLDNAAQMRLPENLDANARQQRVFYTLELFGLLAEKDELVGKISGGQRKRLSIAVEYIGNPSLFFLDEPDSGLDGVMARELMENLRQISDQGRIVMVISHAPDRAIDLFDKVIVLAKSAADNVGHLIFYGPSSEAMTFFHTKSLEEIVRRVNRREEGGEGLADHYMELYKNRFR